MITVEQVKNAVVDLVESKDEAVTIIFDLGVDEDKRRWALLLAWQDGYDFTDNEIKQSKTKMKGKKYDYGDLQITGKIAYQPTNSLMQEYDIDWLMPYDKETGEVRDMEIALSEGMEEIEWLLTEWEALKKELNI